MVSSWWLILRVNVFIGFKDVLNLQVFWLSVIYYIFVAKTTTNAWITIRNAHCNYILFNNFSQINVQLAIWFSSMNDGNVLFILLVLYRIYWKEIPILTCQGHRKWRSLWMWPWPSQVFRHSFLHLRRTDILCSLGTLMGIQENWMSHSNHRYFVFGRHILEQTIRTDENMSWHEFCCLCPLY